MTKSPKSRPATSSWDITARYSPTKWIGTVEAVDTNRAIEEAAKAFKVNDPRKLIAASAGARKLIRERPDERPFAP